ncbi:MAG: histidine kinase [Sphingobacteriaceae bacterium]|nr:MAG: histidine kinase [Sphingobacteriaceae bacterium]
MKKIKAIHWHIIIWTVLILLYIFIIPSFGQLSLRRILIDYVLFGLINISLFYLNYLVFIPKLLTKKKYGLYILTIVAAIIGYALFKYGFNEFLKELIPSRTRRGGPQSMGFYIFTNLSVNFLFVFFSVVLKLSVDWFLSERVQRDLENQRLSAELAFLKSQINPHFLFNSLNSIYSLAYQKSDTTPDAILKLSEIMRYMLYECNDNKVDLAKELQYLQNYIDLQKLRLGNKAYIDFSVEGKVTNQKIVPLLLIAFIENAFKHGISNDEASPIKMQVSVNKEHLQFIIQNKKHRNNTDSIGGIGLSNVRRRLDLLYPGSYNLEIRDEKDTYTSELSLVL